MYCFKVLVIIIVILEGTITIIVTVRLANQRDAWLLAATGRSLFSPPGINAQPKSKSIHAGL